MSVDMSVLSQHVSKEAVRNIGIWLEQPKYRDYVGEIESLYNDESWKELEDSFFKVIEFGTAGRRGTTGVGSNRINRVTIGESAQALCNYLKRFDEQAADKGIAIAFDTRLSSDELSKFTASVCAANGIKTYIFDDFRATPELSFAVRHLNAAAGVVITASHNPPADNGFKIYWSDGGQLVSPHDKGILDEAQNTDEINYMDYDEAIEDGHIILIGNEVDRAYIAASVDESMNDERDISIVYSPLHGTGQTNVIPTLRQSGFRNIIPVGEQMIPDGNFPTIENGKPNPEEKEANKMAVDRMLSEKADLAITNDPDADRIGVMIRQGEKPVYLTGNQSAVLAADYVLGAMKQKGELTHNHYIVETIVTTDMLKALAADYKVRCYGDLLIGFKYIGDLIAKKEDTVEKFVIGGEESYGLLKGTYARDKDGASGALMMAEYAAQLKKEDKTLYDRLLEMFVMYGIYGEALVNIQLPGSDGFDKMQHIMDKLRSETPRELAGYEVSAFSDYQALTRVDFESSETKPIYSVKGNVVSFELGKSDCRVTVRPSGTEPKLKLYIQWREDANSGLLPKVSSQYNELLDRLTQLGADIEQQIAS